MPSSFVISQITPAGLKPLKRAKSKSKKKMLNYLIGHFNENQEEIEKQIGDFIENQIKDLDAINSI